MTALSDVKPIRYAPLAPLILPHGWRVDEAGFDGARYLHRKGLRAIVSACIEDDGRPWLHMSLSRADRLPTWDELREAKDLFIGRDRHAYQCLVPPSEYVNVHPFCLHLFAPVDGRALPDFRKGGTI